MGKVNGYNCDVCGKFGHGVTSQQSTTGDVATVDGTPAGWMRVILPYTHGKSEEAKRDICSGKCLVKFGRERQAIDGGGSGPTTVLSPNGAPKANGNGNGSTPVDPELKAWLAERGIEGRLIGGTVGAHTRFHKNGNVSDTCLVCEYEATREAQAHEATEATTVEA